ncbi:hypothetical protein DSM3645_07216 [Blastopirellula marina DSM 3645]|uniref:Uncharacterized protein n=1 Tax=Blastopirellula marina DSM 3645 TaxID=314230 RepID=A3ZYM1_9BACT|nr:hypothetical protein DSM3645_07216 [Blastopirellula marina DSM 3645]
MRSEKVGEIRQKPLLKVSWTVRFESRRVKIAI